MNAIMSEDFGLYRLEVLQLASGEFVWRIIYLDDDGSAVGGEEGQDSYQFAINALGTALARLGELFAEDGALLVEEINTPQIEGEAGNGTRTHDILLGNFSLSSAPGQQRAD